MCRSVSIAAASVSALALSQSSLPPFLLLSSFHLCLLDDTFTLAATTVTCPTSHSPKHGTSNEWAPSAPTGPAPAVGTTRSYYHHAVIVTSDIHSGAVLVVLAGPAKIFVSARSVTIWLLNRPVSGAHQLENRMVEWQRRLRNQIATERTPLL